MVNISQQQFNSILSRLNNLEEDNRKLKEEVEKLKGRMEKMYNGWAKAKSDLAKLKISLVQRNDLQKVLKNKRRTQTVIEKHPQTKKYFDRQVYGGKSKLGMRKQKLHQTVGHDLIKQV